MTVRSTFSAHRRLVAGLSVLALATAGMTVVATNALFTGTASVATGTFSTGTIVLGTSPTTGVLSFATMAPGDQVWAPITVSNTGGSLPLRYAVTSVPSGTLAANLDLTIKMVPNLAACVAGTTAPTGWATGTAVVGAIPLSTSGVIFGSSGAGQQTGDRPIAANGSEVLCAHVILPGTETTQNLTAASAIFTFHAENT